MAQQVKVLAAKPGDLTLTPGSHVVEGEGRLLQALWPPLAHKQKTGKEMCLVLFSGSKLWSMQGKGSLSTLRV